MSDVDRAKKLFRSFHGRNPKPSEIIVIQAPGKEIVALEVGRLVSIGYKRLDGEKFYHEFESPLAKLCVTPGGRQILIVEGGYRFTDRGFIR